MPRCDRFWWWCGYSREGRSGVGFFQGLLNQFRGLFGNSASYIKTPLAVQWENGIPEVLYQNLRSRLMGRLTGGEESQTDQVGLFRFA